MTRTHKVLLFVILLKLKLASTYIGDCSTKNAGNNLTQICCADFEEIQSVCKPCSIGYTSFTGQKCRPCPENTYGKACVGECICNQFERCDKKIGCVDTRSTEAQTDAHQTSNVITYDFKTTTWLYKASTKAVNTSSGLSTTEVIVYYTLSLVVVIMTISLCFGCIRYKRKRQTRKVDISNTDQESNNRIMENNQTLNINTYDEIDETQMMTVRARLHPEVISHGYLEVVTESGSFTSSSIDSNKSVQNGYLNPYQPFVSTNDPKSSYDILKLEKTGMSFNDGIINIGVQREDPFEDRSQQAQTDGNTDVQNGYLNPYQPCVSTNDPKSSYDILKLETIRISYNDDSINIGVQREDPFEDRSQRVHTDGMSLENIQYTTDTNPGQHCVHDIIKHNKENIEIGRRLAKSGNYFRFKSSIDLKCNRHSSLSLSEKYQTF